MISAHARQPAVRTFVEADAAGRSKGLAGSACALARNVPVVSGMTVDPRQVLGLEGEDAAVRALEARGYVVIARRYRTRLGELDVVASDAGVLVFVEVKTRSSAHCGDGLEAVTAQKRRRLARMAHEYLWLHGLDDTPCRFDVVSIEVRGLGGTRQLAVEVITDAFAEGE